MTDKIFKPPNNERISFFNEIASRGSVSKRKYSVDAYVGGYNIPNAMSTIHHWIGKLREWEAYISATGPVEAKSPFISVVGNLAFISDDYAHLQVVGAKPGFQAIIHIKPKYLDMIRVTLGSEWDADEVIITFFLQTSPANKE